MQADKLTPLTTMAELPPLIKMKPIALVDKITSATQIVTPDPTASTSQRRILNFLKNLQRKYTSQKSKILDDVQGIKWFFLV
jgi:hypothetical protein